MSLFPTPNIFLSIGPFQVTWYALCILTGAMCAYALSLKTVKKWGYDASLLEDYFIPLLGLGILGARFYYVLFQWEYYASQPDEIVRIWHGGLAIHGGLLTGLLFSIYYFKKKKVSFLRMLDAIMPNVLIAQAFGRWGNFFNQEAYGDIVDASFYSHLPSFIKERMFIDGHYRQPTFLFESTLNILGWILITTLFRKSAHKKRGDSGWAYFIWYGMVRFLIESLRSDSLLLGNFKVAQLVSLFFILVGLLGYKGIFDRYKKPILCFYCEKQPMSIIQRLKEKGFSIVLVSNSEAILSSIEEMDQGHDDCIFISDMVKKIDQARNLGLYTILLQEKKMDSQACLQVESEEELYHIVQEEKIWSDNTIW